MAAVEIRNVRKTYPGQKVEVIKGIDAQVAEGEFLVMLGPSGCGKSTLLRMIAGLETITSGEVSIGGRVVNELEPKDRDIAMVFQNYALYPHMTVYDNIAYGLKIRGLARPDIELPVRVLDVQGPAQDDGVLVEVGALAGLDPARGRAHVRDAHALVARVDAPGVLVDELRLGARRLDAARALDQLRHRRDVTRAGCPPWRSRSSAR